MNKKIVVFDVDGTLFDTKRGIVDALNFVLTQSGMAMINTSEEDSFIGPPIKKSLMEQFKLSEEYACQLTEYYREVYVSKFIEKSVIYRNALKVLNELKETGCVLGIATLKTQPQVDRLMNMFAIGEYFDIVLTFSECENASKTSMLRKIRSEYANEVKEFYMVGDTQGDWKAAFDNDYHFIGADYGYGDIKYLQCTHICSIDEVIPIIMREVFD